MYEQFKKIVFLHVLMDFLTVSVVLVLHLHKQCEYLGKWWRTDQKCRSKLVLELKGHAIY